MVKIHNDNEPITHLAMPERQIPILIAVEDARSDRWDGTAPQPSYFEHVDENPSTILVRRVSAGVLNDLIDQNGRRRFETQFGAVNVGEWDKIIKLIDLLDRWNRDDLRYETYADSCELAKELESLTAGSDVVHVRRFPAHVKTKSVVMTVQFAIAEGFTTGLDKARFVIWQDKLTQKLVPGLLCPDILVALYACILWNYGAPGGLAVCQNPSCHRPFIRTRGETQSYCSHSCQTATAMRRYRNNLAKKSRSKTRGQKPTKRR